MGIMYTLLCSACGHDIPKCCAGVQSGQFLALSTVHCAAYEELYDVPVREFSPILDDYVQIPIRCPMNPEHEVVPWSHPGPCPKCGYTMSNLGGRSIWR